MAKSIGTLSAKAVLDSGGFTSGAAAVEAKAKGLGTRLEEIFGRVSAGVRLGSGFFLGFESVTTGSLVQAAKSTFTRVQEVMEGEINVGFLNDQLGTSIGWLTTMRTVAGENSVAADQFNAAMNRLHNVMGAAANGGAEAQATFDQLGLRWQDIRDQDFETSFMQIANAMGAIEDRAVRARLSTELFGREGGQRMLRFMNGGLAGAAADVRGRGGFTTEEDMQRFQEMNTSIDRLSTTWSTVWREFSGSVAPVITGLLGEVNDVIANIRRGIQIVHGGTPATAAAAGPLSDEQRAALEETNARTQRAMDEETARVRRFEAIRAGNLPNERGYTEGELDRIIATTNEHRGQLLAQLQAQQTQLDAPTAEEEAFWAMDNVGDTFGRQLRDVREQLLGTASAAGLSGEALQLHRMKLAANNDAQREAVAQLEREVTARRRAEANMTNVMRLQDFASTPVDQLRRRIGEIQDAGDFMTRRQRGAAMANALGSLDPGQSPLLGNLGIGGSDTAAILQGASTPQISRLDRINATLEAMLQQARETESTWEALGDSLDEIAARLPAFSE